MKSPVDLDSLREPPRTAAPGRVVSLVPSVTESLFELGLGDRLVGITDFCVHPAEAVGGIPRVGGTKNARLEAIIALQPDLVIANQEENTRLVIEQLVHTGVAVWLTFPTTVRAAFDVLWTLVDLFHDSLAAQRVKSLDVAAEMAAYAARESPPVRYFCPIWMESLPRNEMRWMTFNRLTYCHDLLRLMGGENVFADAERQPLSASEEDASEEGEGEREQRQNREDRDSRYPHVSPEEVRQVEPELILLPSEPFAFTPDHQQVLEASLAGTPAVRHGRVHRVDGSLITWHGTRLARALRELPQLFAAPGPKAALE